MALKDYIPISIQASEWLGEFLKKYRPLKPQYALVESLKGNYVFMAPDPGGGGGATCSGNCTTGCTGTCTANCASDCTGGCKTGCKGSCKSSCSGYCTNGCKDGCTGSCSSTCTNDCTKTCQANYCESYCQTCQTFCEYAQVFSQNNGPNKGTGMGKKFTWNRTYKSGDKIIIEATKWDELAGYINNAQIYCGSGESTDVIDDRVEGDVISAAIWNNLNSGLAKINTAVSFVNQNGNVDKIKAAEVTALADKYNDAKINTSLPVNEGGKTEKLCCQKGMSAKETWGSSRACNQTTNAQCESQWTTTHCNA